MCCECNRKIWFRIKINSSRCAIDVAKESRRRCEWLRGLTYAVALFEKRNMRWVSRFFVSECRIEWLWLRWTWKDRKHSARIPKVRRFMPLRRVSFKNSTARVVIRFTSTTSGKISTDNFLTTNSSSQRWAVRYLPTSRTSDFDQKLVQAIFFFCSSTGRVRTERALQSP